MGITHIDNETAGPIRFKLDAHWADLDLCPRELLTLIRAGHQLLLHPAAQGIREEMPVLIGAGLVFPRCRESPSTPDPVNKSLDCLITVRNIVLIIIFATVTILYIINCERVNISNIPQHFRDRKFQMLTASHRHSHPERLPVSFRKLPVNFLSVSLEKLSLDNYPRPPTGNRPSTFYPSHSSRKATIILARHSPDNDL